MVYGNISSFNVETWANLESWTPHSKYTYGFKGFKVAISHGEQGVRCFKKLIEEDENDGKFPMLFCFYVKKYSFKNFL